MPTEDESETRRPDATQPPRTPETEEEKDELARRLRERLEASLKEGDER